jgi:hypothetical protein
MLKDFLRGVLFISLPVFATGVVCVVMCAGAVHILQTNSHEPDPFDARPFDPQEWAAADPQDRAAMARDAIRHLPAGLPEADIQALLGEGEVQALGEGKGCHTNPFTGGAPFGAIRTHSYSLGRASLLWVDVGTDGRVIQAGIWRNSSDSWRD